MEGSTLVVAKRAYVNGSNNIPWEKLAKKFRRLTTPIRFLIFLVWDEEGGGESIPTVTSSGQVLKRFSQKFLFKSEKLKNIYKANTPKDHKNQGLDKMQTAKDSANTGLQGRVTTKAGRQRHRKTIFEINAASPS